jgi:uncharacterized membrane protein YfcA
LLATGAVDGKAFALLAMALPSLAVGVAIGLMLFGRVPEAGFRRAVLILLLATSAGLIVKPSAVPTHAASSTDRW